MNTRDDPDGVLYERDAARLLSVSMRTLQAWRSRRCGPPFVRLGRAVRYPRAQLIEWIQSKIDRSEKISVHHASRETAPLR